MLILEAIDPTMMQHHTIVSKNQDYTNADVEDIRPEQLVDLLRCHDVLEQLIIDPKAAIDTVNQHRDVDADLALLTPYLGQSGEEWQPIWSVHGQGSTFGVNITTGKIVDGIIWK